MAIWDGVFTPKKIDSMELKSPLIPIVDGQEYELENRSYKTWNGTPGGTVVAEFVKGTKTYVLVQFKKSPAHLYVYRKA